MSFRSVVRLYNVLLPAALLMLLPRQLVKMVRRGNFRRHFRQRFGRYAPETLAWLRNHPRPVWIHAVSVGEVLVARKLIRSLRAEAPDVPVVLSCTTTTGFELAEKKSEPGVLPMYRPLDLPGCVSRAFEAVAPRLLVLVESELWPNTVAQAVRSEVPIALVNARLSPRSEARFRRFALLSRPLFENLDLVLTQAPEDVDRWVSLGVPRERIHCTGSIKFDQEGHSPPADQIAEFRDLLRAWRGEATGPVLLAGSTHPGEEKRLGQAFLEIREEVPGASLVVVPRHFERGDEVCQDLRALGFRPIRKTDWDEGAGPRPAADGVPCLVINTTGELLAWYHLADLVFIGKTFLSDEGQNPVEPILAGKPVVTGPEMKNFASLYRRLREEDGCLRLGHLEELVPATVALLRDPERQRRIVENGTAVVAADQGSALRSARLLRDRFLVSRS